MEICEKCQRAMVRRKSVKGEFWGCSGYPECRNIRNIEKSQSDALKSEIQPSIEHIILNRTEKPHSYEFGKAGNRFKIYFGEINELLTQIKLLKEAELINEQEEMSVEYEKIK